MFGEAPTVGATRGLTSQFLPSNPSLHLHEYEFTPSTHFPRLLHVTFFGTEHSSRATVVSMARVLQTPKDVTDRLGGWASARFTSETYIRTHRKLVEKKFRVW